MAITYPLQMPSANARTIRLRARSTVALAESPFTLQSQAHVYGGERWEMEVTLPPVRSLAVAGQWEAFLLALRGPTGYFEAGHPLRNEPQGLVSGAPTVNGTQAAGVRTLNVNNLPASITGVFLRGDLFELLVGSQRFVYKLTADATSNGSGAAALEIWPALRVSTPNNTPVTYTNPKGTWRLGNPLAEFDVDTITRYGITFTAIEYLPIA